LLLFWRPLWTIPGARSRISSLCGDSRRGSGSIRWISADAKDILHEVRIKIRELSMRFCQSLWNIVCINSKKTLFKPFQSYVYLDPRDIGTIAFIITAPKSKSDE